MVDLAPPASWRTDIQTALYIIEKKQPISDCDHPRTVPYTNYLLRQYPKGQGPGTIRASGWTSHRLRESTCQPIELMKSNLSFYHSRASEGNPDMTILLPISQVSHVPMCHLFRLPLTSSPSDDDSNMSPFHAHPHLHPPPLPRKTCDQRLSKIKLRSSGTKAK